jgi:hypothetical protein
MDYKLVREKAVQFMLERGWKQKTAKRKDFDQSLFDHSLVVLDALIALLPVLRGTFVPPLSEQEEQILVTGVVVHDTGKELGDWQEYILGQRGFVSDVNWEHAMQVVPQLAVLFGFTGIEEMLSSVLLHMRHERTPAKVMDRVLFGEHTNERWKTLADIVDQVDNLGSSPGLFAALEYLKDRSMFSNHVRAAYHIVQLRGVSTTLLHRAAIDAFLEKGWSPLLHYSNGTIYVASATAKVDEPTVQEIEAELAKQIKVAMGSEFTKQVVGNPIFTVLPKPELFDYREVARYLELASTRVTKETFARKKEVERFNVATKYLKSVGVESPAEDQLRQQANRIARAYPEMSVFTFFKAMLRQGFLGDPDSDLLKGTYEGVFGMGSFDKFKKSSAQLSPAKHLELVIDPFWELEGTGLGLGVSKVEYAPDSTRRRVLIATLSNIANTVYTAMPNEERPQRATPEEIAKCFMMDLAHPSPILDLNELVAQQLQAYAQSKENARRKLGHHLCPVCNQWFKHGTEALEDFVPSAVSHTNRAVSHSSTSGRGIVICDACKFERFLQQLLLGSKVEEVLVLFPRMNIGHSGGEVLRQKAIRIWEAALTRMSEANPDPDQHLSLAMTRNLAQKLTTSNYNVFRITPAEIVDLMTYRAGDDKRKEYRKNLEKAVKQSFDLDEKDELEIAILNEAWACDFTNVQEALEALVANKVDDDDARKIRAEAFKLHQHMKIVCQTPHLILVPLRNPIQMRVRGAGGKMEDEADVNAAIRELYVTLFLGLALDCSVAVMRAGEVITFEGGEGVARVPPVPALRDLIGAEWVRTDAAKRWLDAIGAAALLANATAFPERSNLYAILKSPTPGHILRRIEQKSDAGQAYIGHIHLLETLKEVLR